MTALSNLSTYLQTYRQLPHHRSPILASKLDEVQAWQRDRMRGTHAELFAKPNNQPMAHYFLYNLYGGETLHTLAQQLERIVPKAQKLEKFAPAAALETGVLGIHCAITATQLDLDIAEWLLANDLPVNEDTMLQAYRTINAEAERCQQLEDLKEVCYRTDKYLNSFILRKAFQMAKGQAYKYQYQPLYDFIAAGFSAMQPLKSVTQFIEPFCQQERIVIADIHKGINKDIHKEIDSEPTDPN